MVATAITLVSVLPGLAGKAAAERTMAGAGAAEVSILTKSETSDRPGAATYVGSAACAGCHAAEAERWMKSPHALALKTASETLELGDLAEPVVVTFGNGASATLTGGQKPTAAIREEGVDPGPYEIPYVFGGRHLSQPLLRFPGGRLQALPLGYDHEKGDWFDIFAASPRGPEDWGHWSNRGMTANSECVACHVTGFREGYHVGEDTYETSYAEASVGCEACHGPGSRHVEARSNDTARGGTAHSGADGDGAGDHAAEKASEGTEAAAPLDRATDDYATPTGEPLMAVCASCHGLRRELEAEFLPGTALLDAYEPVLLQEGDYHADGAVAEEAYEWGSFLQSRMHSKGVVCADCHEPHAGALRQEGDTLCRSCHDVDPKTPAHSHHDDEAAKTTCVSCHMQEKVFMERDRRRDHAFSLPDPAVAALVGRPSPCIACHGEKSEEWAAGYIDEWFPDTAEKRATRRHLVEAFLRAADSDPLGIERVIDCARDCETAIWRATAAKLLAPFAGRDLPSAVSHDEAVADPGDEIPAVLTKLSTDDDDLVRYAAVWSLAEAFPRPAGEVEHALLAATGDPRRAVRANAAWGLRAADRSKLDLATRTTLESASGELLNTLAVRADSAEARFTAGSFHEARGEPERAISEYRGALGIAPASIPPRYRLAMLLSSTGELDDAVAELGTLLDYEPRFAPAHFALGLLYGEQEDWREAVRSLTECLKIDPYYPGALHDLAHAYLGLDQGELAVEVLEAAKSHPRSRTEAMTTLVSMYVAMGEKEAAKNAAKEAAAEMPSLATDPAFAELLGE